MGSLASPKLPVSPGKTYLYKAYYSSGMSFALLAQYYYTDAPSTMQLVQIYPSIGNSWSTVSDALRVPAHVVGVQFIYRLYHDGQLSVNDPYFEPDQNIYIAADPAGTNTIPNGVLSRGTYDVPTDWSTYQSGNNSAAFSYVENTGEPYVETTVSDYKSGQAKWQYTPQSVSPNQYYQLELTYESTATAPIVAEYVLANGTLRDQTVATLPPADKWTSITDAIQTPPGAANLFVSVPLEQDGTLATRDYSLMNSTKPGAAEWNRPLVSITFDDGWQMAYENALPILQGYGYKATFYVNPATIETPGYMSALELDNLVNDGDEIGSGGYTNSDLTALSASALNYQLSEGRNYLRDAGFSVTDLALPYGRSDAEVQYYARKYYLTVRGTDDGVNTLQNLNPYDFKVLYITHDTSPQTIQSALQTTVAEHGWLIFDYHQIMSSSSLASTAEVPANAYVTPATFASQMEELHRSATFVMPVEAAYAQIEQQAKQKEHTS